MGSVYLARDLKLNRPVAIKILRPEVAAAVGTERFLREIKLTAALNHPHIVALHDYGKASGLLFYVMPYVEGSSLRGRLHARRRLPIGEVVQVLRDVVDAVAYAHEQGVVHRDIKPDNVLLRQRHALLTDFGIAKAVKASATPTALTSAGIVLGTPTYMAPEQSGGAEPVDHRADIYAVGVLAYEMLAGAPPFQAESVDRMRALHATQPPAPIAERRRDVPATLAAMIMRCLNKTPAERWQSAEEMLAILEDPSLVRGSTRYSHHERPAPLGDPLVQRILTVAVDVSPAPPLCFGLPGTPEFRGFEVDLLNAMATNLDVELRCISAPWDLAFADLVGGRTDMLCRGVTITPQRRRLLDFSEPYLESELALVVLADSAIQRPDDLAGRWVGVRVATVAEEYVRERCRPGGLRTFETNEAAYRALSEHRVHAVVGHLFAATSFARSFNLRLAGPIEGTRLQLAMAFAKGNDRLRTAVNRALETVRRDGTWQRCYDQWLAEAKAV